MLIAVRYYISPLRIPAIIDLCLPKVISAFFKLVAHLAISVYPYRIADHLVVFQV
jgi:hypothetical protein